MFGSTTPFGQSSKGPFESPSVFGQNNNGSSNAFAPNPFGSSTPFGSSAGGSLFGGTSTSVFGVNSSPLGQHQQSTFGSPSAPAFGTATTGFGAPSAPAFGTSSSSSALGQSSNTPFGASSVFGQNNNASSNPFTPNPFGSTTSFGSPTGGSVFGGTSMGVFGVNSSSSLGQQSACGSPSHPALGTSTAAFGAPSAPAFGTSSSSFGGPSIFGEKSSFGGFASRPNQSSSFGSAFQQSQTICGTNPFGSSSSFGVSTQNASGWTSAPSFAFGTGGAFVAAKPVEASSTSVLGESSTSAVGARRSPAFDASNTTRFSFISNPPSFGQFNSATSSSTSPSFSGTWGSSGAQSTTATFATTGVGQSSFRGQQRGSRLAPYTETDVAADDSSKEQKLQSISCMHINNDKNHEELRWEDYQSGDKGGIGVRGSTIQSTSSSAPNQFVAPIPAFPFTSTLVPGFNSGLSSASPQPSPMFQSVVPLPQTSSFPSFVPPVSQPNMFSPSSLPPMSNLAGLSQTTPFLTTPLEPTQTVQTGPSANSEFPQSSAGLSGFEGTAGVLDQSNFSLPSCTHNTVVAQPVPSVSPFGVLASPPQLSIRHLGSTPPIRYGISSMPVLDKPAAAVRASSLLTSRNLSHRRIRLPAQKYDPKSDGPKVPFFSDDEGMPTASKRGAVVFRRENPRALVVLPAEQWPERSNTEKMSQLVHASLHVYKNGTISAEVSAPALVNGSLCQYDDDHLVENTKSNQENKEQATDVEASMPRLSNSDYYTKPQIPELVANERAEPGFCRHVKNFVVGRHGYGSIKFLGETDVRRLDLDSHVKFNNREVMVYMNEREKPPVGEGLNKAAEVTLLNVKCIDKMGNRYIDGPKVDKYREMLIKKGKEQGAEFMSYDPVTGEWKFRVQHFSRYAF